MEFMTTKVATKKWNIKNIHQLILKDIDNENEGKYRTENVIIKKELRYKIL